MGLLPLLLMAAAAASGFQSCVPARWPSSDLASLELLAGSPLNCLLMEAKHWDAGFLKEAHARGLRVLAVVSPGIDKTTSARAMAMPFDGFAVEGEVPSEFPGRPTILLPPRFAVRLDPSVGVIGTTQGLWPGIRVQKDGAVHAAPTGGPWIETNTGFLRFARASMGASPAIWMANRPPEGTAFGPERYAQAIADAAISSARWVVSFNQVFADELLARSERAVAGWRRILAVLKFYEENGEFCAWADWSTLGLVQDVSSGALYSGGFLDMIAARHIPVSVVPSAKLMSTPLAGMKMLLNTDPAALEEAQKERVRDVARRGGTIVNGPPGWKIGEGGSGEFVFSSAQTKQVEDAWREINGLIGRRNFGVRVFGAPGMLSNLKISPDGESMALHFVNYTSYPLQSITIHALGSFRSAVLLTPQGRRELEVYEAEEATGIDIAKVDDVAILLLRRGRQADQPKR